MALPTIFNCSNDMALAANVRQYFPPKRIQQMEEDLRELALYWDDGPWGWSLCTKQRYLKMGIREEELPSDEWLDEVRKLSSREYACNYIKGMLETLNDDRLVGRDMTFATTIDADMDETIRQRGEMIFKSPWSSSGRGVFTSHNLSPELIRKKLEGFINTQGGYASDRFYSKVCDFAMEFMISGNHEVDFLGYSVFQAAENGAYGFNYVESQEDLKRRIGLDDDLLTSLIDYHKAHLGKTEYTGPVGIDMITLCPNTCPPPSDSQMVNGKSQNGTCIHPCIEINLRMNMGILAILLYNRFGAKANVQLTQKREHGFEAKIDDGKLMIIFKS